MNSTTQPPAIIDGDVAVSYVLVPFFFITIIGIAAAVNRQTPSSAAARVHVRPVGGAERGRTGNAVAGRGHAGRTRLGQRLPAAAPSSDQRRQCMMMIINWHGDTGSEGTTFSRRD